MKWLWFFLFITQNLQGHEAPEAKTPNADTGPDRGKDTVSPPFFQFHPLIIPVIKGNKVVAYLRLILQFKAEDPTKFEEYRVQEPILRDKFFADLYAALSALWIESSPPNIESIRNRLINVANKQLGAGKIQILIKSFYFYRSEEK